MSDLPAYITLDAATRRYGISAEALTQAIAADTVRAVQIVGQEIAVSVDDVASIAEIRREQFANLEGQPISLSDAAREYGIPQPTLSRWTAAGHIQTLDNSGRAKYVDQADVAYCVAVYKAQDGRAGRRIFDENGRPYRPKDRRGRRR